MKASMPLRDRIIFALDLPTAKQAVQWVDRLSSRIGMFKVGLELFVKSGFQVVDAITARNCGVMLDLKFYDIPETVRRAVAQLPGRNIRLATVHGDPAIMAAAAAAKGDVKILAVTVLTSLGEAGLRAMGYGGTVADLVLERARQAMDSGCDGVVCSAWEAAMVRRELGDGFLIVSPGIRLADESADDQIRVATPAAAMAAGVDHMVIGRPIRDAHDPEEVLEKIARQMEPGT